jgi:hypothetical protein
MVFDKEMPVVDSVLDKIGTKDLQRKYDINETKKLEHVIAPISIRRTTGVFFLNDKIPPAMKEKMIIGRKNPKISLKIILKV